MFRYLIVGCALVFATACQAATNESDFAEGMLERLRTAMPEAELRLSPDDPLVIEMEVEGKWDSSRVNLHRLHNYCDHAAPDECDAVLTEFVTNLAEKTPENVATDLRVIVRDREYFDYVLDARSGDKGPLYRQIGEDLFALLAFDGPNTISLAFPERLEELGLDEVAAWQQATSQTRALLPQLPDGDKLADDAAIFADQEYLASLLADTEAWRSIASEAGPDMFAAALSDYFVIVGVMPDGPRFAGLKRDIREDCAKQERCVSPNVYRFRNGRWVVAD